MELTVNWGGGAGPTTKKIKDILRFSRRHDLFNQQNPAKTAKNEQKRQKDKEHDLFCSLQCTLEDTFLTKFGTKTSILKVF